MNLNLMLRSLKIMFSQDKNQALLERNREIITRLKFISTFQPGEKINTSQLHIETNNIITPIKRLITGESRSSTLQFISNTVDRSFEIINTLSHSEQLSEKMLCSSIVQDMINSVHGLKNIQKTYKDDKLFGCTIDTIIDSIQAKLMELKMKKPEVFPEEKKEEEKKEEKKEEKNIDFTIEQSKIQDQPSACVKESKNKK